MGIKSIIGYSLIISHNKVNKLMETNGISFSGSIPHNLAVPATILPLHVITWIQAMGSGAGRR